MELALRGGVNHPGKGKELPLPEFIKLASEALKLTRTHDAFLIINDFVEAVNSVGADGLHLGQDDMPLKEARKIVGNDVIIGISVKTVEEAVQAERDGANYLAINGVFPTLTKRTLVTVLDLRVWQQYAEVHACLLSDQAVLILAIVAPLLKQKLHGIAVVDSHYHV